MPDLTFQYETHIIEHFYICTTRVHYRKCEYSIYTACVYINDERLFISSRAEDSKHAPTHEKLKSFKLVYLLCLLECEHFQECSAVEFTCARIRNEYIVCMYICNKYMYNVYVDLCWGFINYFVSLARWRWRHTRRHRLGMRSNVASLLINIRSYDEYSHHF